jgi:Co/Zn/Cd efflux system component
MYAERVKSRSGGKLDERTKRILEVYIPSFSVTALLAVTGYITADAISTIQSGGDGDDVNIYFLWAFSVANFFVDLFSSLMFYLRGKDGLLAQRASLLGGHPEIAAHGQHDLSHAPLRTFSLDRRSIDMTKRPIIPKAILPNLNMLSALTHVGGDSLRTLSIFLAAVISTAGNQSAALCDAWASVVVSITIVICVIPLCREIYRAAFNLPEEEETTTDDAHKENAKKEKLETVLEEGEESKDNSIQNPIQIPVSN